jgi:hypothetical protein
MAVVAMRAVDVVMIVMMVVIVVAVGAVDVGLVAHGGYSGMKSPGIISPLRDMCTLRPNNMPVFTSPCRR